MNIRSLVTAALLCAAPLAGVQAEPQILGMIAQNDPIPLTCAGGECTAEVSSFCMEPDRSAPIHETAYRPAEGADLALVITREDGSEERLAPDDIVSFHNVRGYASVRVRVAEETLARLGAQSVSLDVGRLVSMLPVPNEKYRRPHEPEEIALALGTRRLAGERIVDEGGARTDAALLMSRLINALPKREGVDAHAREGLWQAVIEAKDLDDGAGWRAARLAKGEYESCLGRIQTVEQMTLRRCLERHHDFLIWQLNSRYWASVAGS